MQVTSQAAGCRYCSAHSGNLAAARGVVPDKVAALWDYERSPLFSDLERAVLRLAQGAARSPSEVTDEDFAAVRRFLDDDQLLEIVAVIAFIGFLNRWNDPLATPLEPAPRSFAERHLAHGGWTIGHHAGPTAAPRAIQRPLPISVRLVMWLLKRRAPKPRFSLAKPTS
jgi:hypothetical protein